MPEGGIRTCYVAHYHGLLAMQVRQFLCGVRLVVQCQQGGFVLFRCEGTHKCDLTLSVVVAHSVYEPCPRVLYLFIGIVGQGFFYHIFEVFIVRARLYAEAPTMPPAQDSFHCCLLLFRGLQFRILYSGMIHGLEALDEHSFGCGYILEGDRTLLEESVSHL